MDMEYTAIMLVNASLTVNVPLTENVPLTVNPPGRYFFSSKQKCDKRSGITVYAPPIIFLGKRPGTKLAYNLRVWEMELFPKQAKACLLHPGMWVRGTHMFCATTGKQTKVRRGSWGGSALPLGRGFTRTAQASPKSLIDRQCFYR